MGRQTRFSNNGPPPVSRGTLLVVVNVDMEFAERVGRQRREFLAEVVARFENRGGKEIEGKRDERSSDGFGEGDGI